uniref:Sushi domain-containing protein n=1 Tax=Poecilia mexicana TaxID=48701 RepID=A0A3B3XAB8_9TELE
MFLVHCQILLLLLKMYFSPTPEVTCPRYIDEAHLYRSVNAWGRNKIGDRVRYDCANNYDPASSDRMATCTREGWTPKPLCPTAEHCGSPPKVENAVVTISYQKEYLHGSSVTYLCRDKYMMEEEPSITCNAGKWETRNITCVRILSQDTQPCTHTLTPRENLEKPINLTVMFWSTQRTHHAQGEHANSMQKDTGPGIEPRTFLMQGSSSTNCCATVQPYRNTFLGIC